MTPIELAKLLALTVFLAFLVESFTEYFFGKLCDLVKAFAPAKPFLFYVSAIAGVLLAFWYKVDLIAWFLSGPVTWVGIFLSGLAIGKGSSFIHDIIQWFFLKISVIKKEIKDDYLYEELTEVDEKNVELQKKVSEHLFERTLAEGKIVQLQAELEARCGPRISLQQEVEKESEGDERIKKAAVEWARKQTEGTL